MPQAGDVKTAFRKMERADAPAAAGAGGFQANLEKEADRGVASSVHIEPQPAPVVAAIMTLTYKVLRQSGEQFVETAPDTVFASGDVVRLAVVPPADGQLVLHADPEVTLHTVAAKKGEPVIIPATGGIKLGPGAGSRTVRLVFAAPIEAKGMANTMRARSASAQQTADSSSGSTPLTVDVVLQFR